VWSVCRCIGMWVWMRMGIWICLRMGIDVWLFGKTMLMSLRMGMQDIIWSQEIELWDWLFRWGWMWRRTRPRRSICNACQAAALGRTWWCSRATMNIILSIRNIAINCRSRSFSTALAKKGTIVNIVLNGWICVEMVLDSFSEHRYGSRFIQVKIPENIPNSV
jgi:hypothetical protein